MVVDKEASSTKSKVNRGEGVTAASAAWLIAEEVATTADEAEADRKMLPRLDECGD